MFSALLRSDYYGGSVALDLSVCRQSRVPSVMYVLASVRLSTHPLIHPRWVLFHDMKVAPAHDSCRGISCHRYRTFFRWAANFTKSGLEFKQFSFSHTTRILRVRLIRNVSGCSPRSHHATVPFAFQVQVR